MPWPPVLVAVCCAVVVRQHCATCGTVWLRDVLHGTLVVVSVAARHVAAAVFVVCRALHVVVMLADVSSVRYSSQPAQLGSNPQERRSNRSDHLRAGGMPAMLAHAMCLALPLCATFENKERRRCR